jgi:hypothetical protein
VKLYLVHCGFYDHEIGEGVYESHTNFFVVARDFEDARARAKENAEFRRKKMHVDGLQEVQVVDGFRIEASEDAELAGRTVVVSSRHRDLAPKPLAGAIRE